MELLVFEAGQLPWESLTPEEVLASVQKAQGADFVKQARLELMFGRMDGWPERTIETVMAYPKDGYHRISLNASSSISVG